MNPTEAYPLKWPDGWPRTAAHQRKRAKFGKGDRVYSSITPGASYAVKKDLTISDGAGRIAAELGTMGVREGQWLISSNLELRNDGTPRSGQRAPADPGVAVYWTRKGKQQVMAIDRYDRVADNLAAVAATLAALRAIERHGGGQILDRAFEGFTALGNPDTFDPYAVMGLKRQNAPFPRDFVNLRFREMSRIYHPDVPGTGSTVEFQRLNRARDELLKTAT